MRQIVVLMLALMFLAQPGAAWAQPASREGSLEQVSYGAGSVAGTLAYTPLKAVLCFMGGSASGLLFVTSGAKAASTLAGAACKGTWIITPDILKGKEPLKFVDEVP